MNLRVGNGYDVHRLVENRDFILGGVKFNYHLGLLGHSDADVLLHAIMDSILSPLGLGDIGQNFPDSDAQYKGISSLSLLAEVGELLKEKNAQIINIDVTVICELPKVSPHIEEMKVNISKNLPNMDNSQINIKGTTSEGLGFTGRGEGVAVYATTLLQLL